jgi:carbonic anhydrase/acetyltransferase-like protein (isoleucine patch superfamily)
MKYEFTGEVNAQGLKRIRRISDGLIGGFIEREANLPQDGACFVYDNAQVYGNAWVYGHARVFDNAQVYGNAQVHGNTLVSGNARVFDNVRVFGNASVFDNAWVYSNAWIYGNARVFNNAQVYGNARVYGDALVTNCLSLQQPRYDITCTDTHVFIGCKCHTWGHWAENYQGIGEAAGYTQAEINETVVLLNVLYVQIRRMMKGDK